jgi:hypothetical protein
MPPKPKKKSGQTKASKATPAKQPAALFQVRLLGYLVGLIPLVALLLMFRQMLPSTVGLVLVFVGFMASVWVQQRARQQYPYDFKNRAEWLALGAYTLIVVLITAVFLTLLW